MFEQNPELRLAFDFLQDTGENIFLTGKAGTGKTTFLHNLRKICPKRMVVLAPTGVAAINAGGVTIHSFFQLSFGPQVPGANRGIQNQANPAGNFRRFSKEKLNIIRTLDLLVIDEISMVRADLLDAVDEVLKFHRKSRVPFGGVQLLLIGDLQQLAPVVKDDEWELLRDHYSTPFFFGSRALHEAGFQTIELKKVYRQSDQEFIDLLNKVRTGTCDKHSLDMLNLRFQPGIRAPEGCIVLTTHNFQAQKINSEKINELQTRAEKFEATIEGDFPEYVYPTDLQLTLKIGAQVMFVKNDSSPEKRYFNGKIGKVTDIEDKVVIVNCPGDPAPIEVSPDVWQNVKYGLNRDTNQIEENVVGTFTQYPLKTAWAITIHKSQGLTFDNVVIDAKAAFAHGQVYVALSRCRTLGGLILSSPLSSGTLISDESIKEFSSKAEACQPGQEQLSRAKIAYQRYLLGELFDFSSPVRLLQTCTGLIREHQTSIPSVFKEKCTSVVDEFKKEISSVSDKFSSQIPLYTKEGTNIEQCTKLQERLRKASAYYEEKLGYYASLMLQSYLSGIDNKEVRERLSSLLNSFEEEIIRKRDCFKSCKNGFSAGEYMQARANSLLDKRSERRSVEKRKSEEPQYTEHTILYNRLRDWREEKAREKNLPEYMLLAHKTVINICVQLPSNLKELRQVKGIGKRKIESFGSEIVEIVTQYCSEKGIEVPAHDSNVEEERPQIKKGNTNYNSLELFRSGKNVEEIAAHRGLAVTTIEGHLSYFISTGELDVFQFLAPPDVSEITDFFVTQGKMELTPAKNFFGEKYTYGELRMVVNHLRKEKNQMVES